MPDKPVSATEVKAPGETPAAAVAPTTPPIPPRRSPGHRGADVRDTVAEMAAKAQEISQEAGSKMAAAMKDVINAAAGIAGFAVESARDLVQYMVRRGQMTQEEADKLIREAEAAQVGRTPPPPRPAPPAKAAPAATFAPVVQPEAPPVRSPTPVVHKAVVPAPAAKAAPPKAAHAPAPAAKKAAAPSPKAAAKKPTPAAKKASKPAARRAPAKKSAPKGKKR